MLSMGESKGSIFLQESWFQLDHKVLKNKDDGVVIDEDDAYSNISSSSSSSFESSSTVSNESSSSLDTVDDASSTVSCLSSSNSSEGLYDLSDIMAELPIKKGLSKFYHGKSESFTSLSRVTSVTDLAKKVNPYMKMKTSKSYGGLDAYKSHTRPNRVISKKCSTNSCKPPMAPGQKNLGC